MSGETRPCVMHRALPWAQVDGASRREEDYQLEPLRSILPQRRSKRAVAALTSKQGAGG